MSKTHERVPEGYIYFKMIYERGRPQDFICLYVNSAFDKLTGLKDVDGKSQRGQTGRLKIQTGVV